jgi:cytoskeletal protein CcmA (bactofilin family)
MSIFSHSKGEPNKSLNGSEGAAKPNTAPTSGKKSPDMVSTLGPAMQVTGNIVCEGSLQIFGRVIGDIHVSNLVICEGARVEGNIIAHEASIHGVFKGNIHGNKVKLIFNSCGVGMGCKSLIFHESRIGFLKNVVPRHGAF